MPRIIGQAEQQSAMKEIRVALREMESTNLFLNTANKSGKYSILFTADDGTRCSAIAFTEKKEDIDRFVLHHKHRIANRVKALAEENRIALEIDEKLALGIDLTEEEEIELDQREMAALEAASAQNASDPENETFNHDQTDGTDQPYYNNIEEID